MAKTTKGNKSFVFGTTEFNNSFKVFLWTVGSALIALLIDYVGMVDIPAQYTFIVPLINTVLYSLKEWFSDNS